MYNINVRIKEWPTTSACYAELTYDLGPDSCEMIASIGPIFIPPAEHTIGDRFHQLLSSLEKFSLYLTNPEEHFAPKISEK